ncbi:DUF2877 domain-containing protein [Sphaerisporangium fuscum]|uniref:DUF2877 domain-containing protein n=1 Tax=Sphaerisporangium fuscum TaxID=2835868 RepID=UPI001BDD381E|nr:DUF2877 domain-containing protein [Sphaerisporangium fuscum]
MTLGTRTPTRQRSLTRAEVFGAASTALRPALEAPRRPARVLAAFPLAIYVEIRGDVEPSVVALVTGEATRPPNAIVLNGTLPRAEAGDEAAVGDGSVEVGNATLRVRRWWDPSPALGDVPLSRLARVVPELEEIRRSSSRRPGLGSGGAGALLAEGCAEGSLATAITAAEQLMGLGPGLTPSGDDMLAGLLVALRLLGAATGVSRAVWLADWLAATVAFDAPARTTPISSTLLQCAARGQGCSDALAVLRAIAGERPLAPAAHRLLRLGHTSGADLAWGLSAGTSAVLSLGGKAAAAP